MKSYVGYKVQKLFFNLNLEDTNMRKNVFYITSLNM
jgi:hypothetical protein